MDGRFWGSEEYDERAHSLYNQGDYDGALKTLKQGLALYPNAVELYAGLGHARLVREEYAWARIAFERALVLDPAHEDAMVGMGEVLLRLGRASDGIRLFQGVEALGYTDDVELMLTMGRVLYREGLFAEAKDVFTRLVTGRPDTSEAVAGVGYCLHRMGDDVEAGRYLRRALKMDPDLHEARTRLGQLLYDCGDWEGSLRELERVPPPDQWDALAVWRVIELKSSLSRVEDSDPRMDPWRMRLNQLEEAEADPVEEMLAEIESSASGSEPWAFQDESQLELFDVTSGQENPDAVLVRMRLSGGQVIQGTWHEAVRQFRDHAGFSHEPVVPSTDPEAFLRRAAEFGLLRLTEPSEDVGMDDPK